MIDPGTVNKIKQASVVERIRLIKLILQSLKMDSSLSEKDDQMNKFNDDTLQLLKELSADALATESKEHKPFKVRRFSLGEEVHVNRDEIYADRGI